MDPLNASMSSSGTSTFASAASTLRQSQHSPRAALQSPAVSNRHLRSVLNDKYLLSGEELGRGAYGQVILCLVVVMCAACVGSHTLLSWDSCIGLGP